MGRNAVEQGESMIMKSTRNAPTSLWLYNFEWLKDFQYLVSSDTMHLGKHNIFRLVIFLSLNCLLRVSLSQEVF